MLWIAAAALAGWVWLALARGGYWRTDVRLPAAAEPGEWPPVAVVIPARDEAEILPRTVPTLVEQDYPGPLRVILVDDGSTDGTAELVAGEWPQVELVAPGEPPPGWAGKVWALAAGTHAAGTHAAGTHAAGTHAAGSHAAGTAATRTATAGPDAAGPDAAGPDAAGPDAAGPDAAGPDAAGPDAAGPDAASTDAAGEVPQWLLLSDADIAHRPDSLRRLVSFALADDRALVSQMAHLRAQTAWERLIVPAFVYFFALLYPFRWSNRPGARTAAAAGGCTLVRRDALQRAGGIAAIRGAVIDDVALARAVKRAGGRTWLGLADGVDSVRPYPALGDLWRMVSRSAYAQLRHSPPLLAGTVAGLALMFWVPPAALVYGLVVHSVPTAIVGGAGWLLMAALYAPMLRYYRQPVVAALALPATATLYLAMTVDSAGRHYAGRGAAWKGRTYGPQRTTGL